MAAYTYDHLVKLLLLGDSGVGKTCLTLRFADDQFTPSFVSTIGIDFRIRTMLIGDKRIKFQIWDTAGQERFQSITASYYRGAMGIILVYSIIDEKSFNNVKTWMGNIEKFANANVKKLLIANKTDLVEQRVVTEQQGVELAAKYKIKFFETSAKDSFHVTEAFVYLATEVLKETDNPIIKPNDAITPCESQGASTIKASSDIVDVNSNTQTERVRRNHAKCEC